MDLQNTLRDLFAQRRQPNARLGGAETMNLDTIRDAIENNENEPQEVVETIDPSILPDVPAPDPEPEYT
jgi:hypothetical protein